MIDRNELARNMFAGWMVSGTSTDGMATIDDSQLDAMADAAIAYFQEQAQPLAGDADAIQRILGEAAKRWKDLAANDTLLYPNKEAMLGAAKIIEDLAARHSTERARVKALQQAAREVAEDLSGLVKALWSGKTRPTELRYQFFEETVAKLRANLSPEQPAPEPQVSPENASGAAAAEASADMYRAGFTGNRSVD